MPLMLKSFSDGILALSGVSGVCSMSHLPLPSALAQMGNQTGAIVIV
jgi:hypothetical protein